MVDFQEKRQLIRDLKYFATHELGIPQNHSFERMGENKTYYALYVSEPDCVKSPIICHNKREYSCPNSFKNIQDRDENIKKFLELGKEIYKYDTPAIGDKNCTITPNLLKYSVGWISYIIFHEQFHILCEAKPLRQPLNIEESIADVFAYQATREYFGKNSRIQKNNERFLTEEFPFDEMMTKYLQRLDEAYAKNEAEGKKIIKEVRSKILVTPFLPTRLKSQRKRKALSREINNAFFVMKRSQSPFSREVYEALENLDPREYSTDRSKLNHALKDIPDWKP